MKTLSYIILTAGVMAVVVVLGFAGDRFGPLGSMVLVIVVLSLFVVVGLRSGVTGRAIPKGVVIPNDQATWASGASLANSNWLDLIVDHQEMVRYISLEVDRSRRFGRTFTVIVIAPDLKQLAGNGVDITAVSELQALRLFTQEVAVKQLRTTDIVSNSVSPSVTIAMLPETDSDGTNIAVERIREAMAFSRLRVGLGGQAELKVSVMAVNYPGDVTDTTGFIETISEFEDRVSAAASSAGVE